MLKKTHLLLLLLVPRAPDSSRGMRTSLVVSRGAYECILKFILKLYKPFSLKLQYRTKKMFKGSVWSKKSFPFFAENMIIRSILNLWWHSEILKLILGVIMGMFTKRLKRTRRLLYTVKSDFFEMTALHSKC